METTLAYWHSTGAMISPLGALVWLLACIWLALNLKMP